MGISPSASVETRKGAALAMPSMPNSTVVGWTVSSVSFALDYLGSLLMEPRRYGLDQIDDDPDPTDFKWWVSLLLKQGLLALFSGFLLALLFGFLDSPMLTAVKTSKEQSQQFIEAMQQFAASADKIQQTASQQQTVMTDSVKIMADTQKMMAAKDQKLDALLRLGVLNCRRQARLNRSQDDYERCDEILR